MEKNQIKNLKLHRVSSQTAPLKRNLIKDLFILKYSSNFKGSRLRPRWPKNWKKIAQNGGRSSQNSSQAKKVPKLYIECTLNPKVTRYAQRTL
jgi:hypothetical protein